MIRDNATGELGHLQVSSGTGLAAKPRESGSSTIDEVNSIARSYVPVKAHKYATGEPDGGGDGDKLDGTRQAESERAPRIAMILIFLGMIANWVIAHLAHGDKTRILFGRDDWMADFVKHTMSFPGPPIAPSMYPNLIKQFQEDFILDADILGHFHNMPETVLMTLLVRPAMSVIDPIVLYLLAATVIVAIWVYLCQRYVDEKLRAQVFGIALFNYPLALMLERGNLFAGITAICLLVVLCRRKRDWLAVFLLVIAGNIRPNIVIVALPLLAYDRGSFLFIVRTAVLGALVATVCLIADSLIYPDYTLLSWLAGLKFYSAGYVVGPLGSEFGSSLWGAMRHVVGPTGANVAFCTVAGLVPLGLAWMWRHRLSYSAQCFLAIAACTLSTAVLADYHLLLFIVPLLMLKRDDQAFWSILLGSCWMLIPKNYNVLSELSWQTYFNPAGLVVAVWSVWWSYTSLRAGQRASCRLQLDTGG